MQQRGRGDEAGAIGQRAGGTDLAAMRMTMEQREGADDGGADTGREAHSGRDQQAEGDDGGENRGLDEGQCDAGECQHEAKRHAADKGERHADQRAATDLEGPDADGDHGEDMVGTEERVGDTGRKRAVLGGIEMGKGGRGACNKHCGAEGEGSKHEMILC